MRNNDFDHLVIRLITAEGLEEDISDVVVSMNIHEDVYADGMYGNLLVQDPDFILERLLVRGEDKLIIEFSSGAKDGFFLFKKVFDIVDIQQVSFAHKTATYNIQFQSQFIYAASSYLLSIYVEGKTHDIVQSIFKEHLQYEEPLLTENCLYYRQFIIPRWSALDTIKYLAMTAQSSTNKENRNYVFFERSDLFMFGSLEGLMDFGVKEILEFRGTKAKEYRKNIILDWTIPHWYQRDNLVKTGFFGSTVYGIDPVKTQFSISQQQYSGKQNPAWTYSPQAHQLITNTSQNNAGVHDWGHKSNGAWNNLSLDVQILGNTNLTVGDVVQLVIPSYIFAELNKANDVLPDEWLITHVHHTFFEGEYKQTLNLRNPSWKR